VLSKKQDLASRFLILVAIGMGVGTVGSSMLGIQLPMLGWTFVGSVIVLGAGLILWLFRNRPWFYQEADPLETNVSLTPV
jgi:hypothetical protein